VFKISRYKYRCEVIFRFDRTELIKIIQMHQMHQIHPNPIKQSSVRSNRTRKNIEILKKFGSREAMSVRFGSVGEKSSRVSL